MSWKRWFALLLGFIGYLLIGGVIFMALESPAEIERHHETRNFREQIYETFIWNNASQTDPQAREQLLNRLASTYNFMGLVGQDDPPLRWNMFNSFFFAVTVTTTIGYGHMAPTTGSGRIFCMVFALIGIPVNGILLATLGEYFGTKLIKRSRLRAKAQHYGAKLELFLYVLLYLVPGIILFIALPAGLFVIVEGWEYLDAFYYSFISLTTIGFGDFVAGQIEGSHWIWLYKSLLIFWIVFGLGFLVMVINVITKGLKSKPVQNLEKRILNTTRLADAKKLRSLINEIAIMRVKPVYLKGAATKGKMVRTGSQPFLSEGVVTYSPETENSQRPPANRRSSDTALNDIDRGATFARHIVRSKDTKDTQILDDVEDPVRLLARLANHLVAHEEDMNQTEQEDSNIESDDENQDWGNQEEIFPMEEDEESGIPLSNKLPRHRFFRVTSVCEEREAAPTLIKSLPTHDQPDFANAKKPVRNLDKPEVDHEDSQETTIVAGCCSGEPLFGSLQAWNGSRSRPTESAQYQHPDSLSSHISNSKFQRQESVRSNFLRNPASIFGSLIRRPSVVVPQRSDPIPVITAFPRNASLIFDSARSWDERLSVSSGQLNEAGQYQTDKTKPEYHGSRTVCCRHTVQQPQRTTAAEFAQLLEAVRDSRLQQRKISHAHSQFYYPHTEKT